MALGGMPSARLDFDVFYNVIGGKLSETVNTITSKNPSTLTDNPPFPLSTAEDVNKAVEAANLAAPLWRRTSWSERQAALTAFADALEALSEDFIEMVVKEQGKPVRLKSFKPDPILLSVTPVAFSLTLLVKTSRKS